MAFTGSITRKEMIGGKLRIHYRLNDGAGAIIDEFVETTAARNLTWLANYVLARCAEVDSLAAFQAAIPEGTVTKPSDPPPPPPPDPIVVGFREAVREARAVKQLVDSGVILPTDTSVSAARSDLKTRWDSNPGYHPIFKLILGQ